MANGENDLMGGLSAAVQPMAQPMAQPTGGLNYAFDDDDYTGRIGPDGEPERYSTMRGGDPRVAQQRELEEYARRLQDPITLSSWMTGAKKDVRGLDPASQITLTPGTQYQIRDYTGKNDGQVIASGSTPEELLRLQDVARGLANQGRMADYRIEQVGGTPTGGLAQYRDPTTGEAVTLLGGDLYNSPGTKVVGDILKIAAPIALQFVPGFGTVLGTKLGLSGLAAKAAGVGLTSALGRAGAGLVTGENIGDALKAGAIGGLGSAATAGLLGATGVDKALGSALGSGKGALIGEGVREAAASVPGEILVSASRLAPAVLGGLGAAGGSLLGDVGKSLDPFKQALDQARLDNEFGLGDMVVSGSRIPQAGLDSILAGAVPSSLNVGTPTDTSLPGEDILVEASRTRPGPISSAIAAGTPSLLNLGTPTDVSVPGEDILVEASRTQPGRVSDSLAAATGAVIPSQPAPAVAGEEPIQTVTGKRNEDINLGGLDLRLPIDMTLPGGDLVTDTTTPPGEKKTDISKKIGAGAGVLTLLDQLLGGGGGGGGGGINSTAGTRASLSPIFSAKLPEARGIFSPASFAPRDMSGTDFARYGYGPAKSFFENVPRNVEEYKAALAANSAPRPAPTGTAQPGLTVSSTGQSTPGVANPQFAGVTTVAAAIRRLAPDATDEQIDAYLSGPEGARFLEIMNESGITQRRARGGMMAAKGGASRGRDAYAVRGPGTGRSDEIPALLSDGEYVIDAETVSMLGDGSGEAGAKRLDEFRIKIRKHKGRNLARGKFSDNAKRPDKYLSGGRV